MNAAITIDANVYLEELHTLVRCVEKKTTEFGSYAFVDRMLGTWALSGRVIGKSGVKGAFSFTPQHRMATGNPLETATPDFAALMYTLNNGVDRDELVFLWECKIDLTLKWWTPSSKLFEQRLGQSTLAHLDQVQRAVAVAIKVYNREVDFRSVYAFLRVNAHFTLMRFKAIPGKAASGGAILLEEFGMQMEFVYFVEPIFEGDFRTNLRPSLAFLHALEAATLEAADEGLRFPRDSFFAVPANARHKAKPTRGIHNAAKDFYVKWLTLQQESARRNQEEMNISATTAVSSNDNYVPEDLGSDNSDD